MEGLQLSSKVSTKYNLRCNRSVSEKMMKKDFIYDIRRPIQIVEKKPIVSFGIIFFSKPH